MSIENNPLVKPSPHKYGAVPFNEIKQEHFIPALEYAIKKAEMSDKGIDFDAIIEEVKDGADVGVIAEVQDGEDHVLISVE